MVESEILPTGILVLRPSGPISAEDVDIVREKVDSHLAADHELRGLMIEAASFPGWKDLAGMCSHLRFIRDHHRMIPRVAIVSDSAFLAALPKLARHFHHAEFRRFDTGESEAALAWLSKVSEPDLSAIRRGWFPDRKLIWIYVHGTVHTGPYRELAEWMEGIITEHKPVSFLIDLEDLGGVDFGAVMTDLKFGLKHVGDIRRMALVGNRHWTRRLASLPNPFSMEIRAFSEAEEHEAWDWASA
jgi:hypothetical protein